MKSPTPDNLDIHRTACTLVRKHGEFADALAAIRHDELLVEGDVNGVIVWGKIVKADRGLLAQGVPEGAVVH